MNTPVSPAITLPPEPHLRLRPLSSPNQNVYDLDPQRLSRSAFPCTAHLNPPTSSTSPGPSSSMVNLYCPLPTKDFGVCPAPGPLSRPDLRALLGTNLRGRVWRVSRRSKRAEARRSFVHVNQGNRKGSCPSAAHTGPLDNPSPPLLVRRARKPPTTLPKTPLPLTPWFPRGTRNRTPYPPHRK